MTTLKYLPRELILEILSYLPNAALENAAWTLSHPITELSITLLQPIFKSRRDKKRLVERPGPVNNKAFPPISLRDFNHPDTRDKLGFSLEDTMKIPAADRIPDLEYLGLCGDFKWLEPLPGDVEHEMLFHYQGPATDHAGYDELVSSADRAGVILPPAFLKFIQDEELQKRIPPSNAAHFTLHLGGLRKVPKSRDGGVGGYKITFLAHQRELYVVSLYIEPGKNGASCVLMESKRGCTEHGGEDCPSVAEEDERDADKMGLKMMEDPCVDLALLGVDFETWLAANYYNELLWGFLNFIVDAGPRLQEYVKREFLS